MKVRPSVKPMCDKCKIIKKKRRVMVICSKYPTQSKDRVRQQFQSGNAANIPIFCGRPACVEI